MAGPERKTGTHEISHKVYFISHKTRLLLGIGEKYYIQFHFKENKGRQQAHEIMVNPGPEKSYILAEVPGGREECQCGQGLQA